MDGAIGGAIGRTERTGLEFTPADPVAAASAAPVDCVPVAAGATASRADAPDAAAIAARPATR